MFLTILRTKNIKFNFIFTKLNKSTACETKEVVKKTLYYKNFIKKEEQINNFNYKKFCGQCTYYNSNEKRN